MADFKDLLAEALAEAEIDAAEVARRTGIHTTYVLHMLAGRRVPDLVTLNRIAQALGWGNARAGRAMEVCAAAKRKRPGRRAAVRAA